MGIYRRKDTEYWWYRFRVNGQEYRGTTGETDKRKAEKISRRIQSEVEAKNPSRKVASDVGLAEVGVLDIERAVMAKNVAQEIETLKTRWRSICEILGADTKPSKIGALEIEQLARELGRRQRGQTVRRHLTALKRGLKLAKRRGWILEVPDEWPRIKSDPIKTEQAGKWHEPAIVAAWLRELRQDARDEATVVLFTGLRWGEIKRIVWKHIRPAPPDTECEFALHLPAEAAKTRKARVIPLPPSAMEVLERRARTTAAGEPLFRVASHKGAYRAAARRIHYAQRINLRDLRHMYATQADWLSQDRKSAQDLLGHTTEAMTARYLHSTAQRLGAVAGKVGDWLDATILRKKGSQSGTAGGHSKGKAFGE